MVNVGKVNNPPGYTDDKQDKTLQDDTPRYSRSPARDALKVKRAWELATSSFKTIPMNAFMMYMSGNSVQIFSMMIIWTTLTSPIRAAIGLQQVFAPYENPIAPRALWGPKMVYLTLQLATLALGIWKISTMGLLPTSPSDWLTSTQLVKDDYIIGTHVIES